MFSFKLPYTSTQIASSTYYSRHCCPTRRPPTYLGSLLLILVVDYGGGGRGVAKVEVYVEHQHVSLHDYRDMVHYFVCNGMVWGRAQLRAVEYARRAPISGLPYAAHWPRNR